MVGIFALLAMVGKLPIGLSLALSALGGALLSGQGFALRHLVEGGFGYFDTILIIVTAMIFMQVLKVSGILDTVTAVLLKTFYRRKLSLLLTVMLIIMFPGMITGSSTVAVLSTGTLVAPVLIKLGLSKVKAAALIAMGAILGMIAPPVNILVMIMGGGVDMPYVGLTVPLLIIVIPLALFISLYLGYRDIRIIEYTEMQTILPESQFQRYGIRLYIPLLVVFALLLTLNMPKAHIPDIGIPAIFLLGSLTGLVCGRPFNFLTGHSGCPQGSHAHPEHSGGSGDVHSDHDAHRRTGLDGCQLPLPPGDPPLRRNRFQHAPFWRGFRLRFSLYPGRAFYPRLDREKRHHHCLGPIGHRRFRRPNASHSPGGHICGPGREREKLFQGPQVMPDPGSPGAGHGNRNIAPIPLGGKAFIKQCTFYIILSSFT